MNFKKLVSIITIITISIENFSFVKADVSIDVCRPLSEEKNITDVNYPENNNDNIYLNDTVMIMST